MPGLRRRAARARPQRDRRLGGRRGARRASAVFLDDSDTHPRVRERLELTRRIIEPTSAGTHVVASRGRDHRRARLLARPARRPRVALPGGAARRGPRARRADHAAEGRARPRGVARSRCASLLTAPASRCPTGSPAAASRSWPARSVRRWGTARRLGRRGRRRRVRDARRAGRARAAPPAPAPPRRRRAPAPGRAAAAAADRPRRPAARPSRPPRPAARRPRRSRRSPRPARPPASGRRAARPRQTRGQPGPADPAWTSRGPATASSRRLTIVVAAARRGRGHEGRSSRLYESTHRKRKSVLAATGE